MYAKDTLEGQFGTMGNLITYKREFNTRNWISAANKYLNTLGISWGTFQQIDRKELKAKIRDWDNNQWLNELREQPTLHLYGEAKLNLGYE